jgi:hypothetical protein
MKTISCGNRPPEKRQNSTHNAEVEGSSPPLTTKIKHLLFPSDPLRPVRDLYGTSDHPRFPKPRAAKLPI